MLDKIQPNLPASYINDVTRPEDKGEIAAAQVRQADGVSAEVSLSRDARAIQRALQAVKDAPDIREDVVQQIRGDIEAGRYEINFEALASRLLSFLK